jgi:hypothetical protein
MPPRIITRYQSIGTISGITKANPGVITIVAANRPIDPRVQAGVYIYLDNLPGWTTLDNKTVQVASVNHATGVITTNVNTTAETANVPADGKVSMHN